MKRFFTSFFLFIYFIVNFVNFTGLSVCMAKDHIGLNLFGYENSCIEIIKNCHHNENKINIVSHQHDDCEDKNLSTNTQEILPDFENINYLEECISSDNNIFIQIFNNIFINNTNRLFLFYKNIHNNIMLSGYKIIRLLI